MSSEAKGKLRMPRWVLLVFDSDQWEEVMDSLSRNKSRTFLTAFGIFWGIFMLVALMGGGKGLESMLARNFAGFASNSGFMISSQTSMAYKGFKTGRRWNIDLMDVQRVKSCVPEIDVCTPAISNWGSIASADNHSMSVSVRGGTSRKWKTQK